MKFTFPEKLPVLNMHDSFLFKCQLQLHGRYKMQNEMKCEITDEIKKKYEQYTYIVVG